MLCDRFKKLPSEIYAEDAELLRMLEVEWIWKENERQEDGEE